MNLVGKWKVCQMMSFDSESGSLVYKTKDELSAQGDENEALRMFGTLVEFTEDGEVIMLLPIPEGVSQEQIDEAVKSGKAEIRDGMIAMEKKAWKEEDGKYFYDSGTKGEVLGKPVSPWVELTIEDGLLVIPMMKLEKVE